VKGVSAKRVAALCGAAVTVAILTGCSSTGDSTTCADYLAADTSEQQSILMDLLREHDLKTLDPGNLVGITDNVTAFCANSGNGTASLNGAVDWDSSTW